MRLGAGKKKAWAAFFFFFLTLLTEKCPTTDKTKQEKSRFVFFGSIFNFST
jgi:hypothetical protein